MSSASPALTTLGDLSGFPKIASDVQGLVAAGDLAGAKTRIADLESSWDAAEASIRPLDKASWITVDSAIDDALAALRAAKPVQAACAAALTALLADLADVSAQTPAAAPAPSAAVPTPDVPAPTSKPAPVGGFKTGDVVRVTGRAESWMVLGPPVDGGLPAAINPGNPNERVLECWGDGRPLREIHTT